MATVELSLPPLPAHVRTARLVAVSAARRLGLDEEVVGELRLAVGEACARAVKVHAQHCPEEPVTVILDDDGDRFAVTVVDRAEPLAVPVEGRTHADVIDLDLDLGLGLAVLRGLVDDVEVHGLDSGTTVRMSWPADAVAGGFAGADAG